MPKKRKQSSSPNKNTSGATSGTGSTSGGSASAGPPASDGFLISCDIPTKQFIMNLNQTRNQKFVLKDLDEKHILVKASARKLIHKEVEEWMDKNVWSSVERVGEDLDMS
mmetsp:Transcript_24685/g.34486  ORF Transcript_24685/g.34486 Transcript_24685/m.34486 type:complete len:110 (-) Transcript_24685:392-721(-)